MSTTVHQETSTTPPPPPSFSVPAATTPAGDGNVMKKVVSFTVERTNSDNASLKLLRPSYVPEKLNFGAYEKFEGE